MGTRFTKLFEKQKENSEKVNILWNISSISQLDECN